MSLENARSQKRKREEYKKKKKDKSVVLGSQVRGLTTVINIDKFHYRLTCWIVNCHIAFVEVENSNF